jgi:phosphotriesterase-related protein
VDQVETVRGSVPLANLGATLMHEHIFIKHPELEQNYPNPEWDEDRPYTRRASGRSSTSP